MNRDNQPSPSHNRSVPTGQPHVLNGVDRIRDYAGWLKGKRLGLVTGPTGLTRQFQPTIDLLREQFRLCALFSPEHGLYGEVQAGDKVASTIDARTGLPVHSLYGATREPSPDMLEHLDALVFDMQDIGVRYYTYAYTLSHVMKVCSRLDMPLYVLDRVNPLGGVTVAGNILDPAFASFVGEYALPVVHGLTIGEFARWVNRETGMGCPLEVIPCKGWKREMSFEQTGLPWVMPSPNMPSVDTVRCYAGTCLFEGTNLSEGRGTTRPFELVGAPSLDGETLAKEMNRLSLPGVIFRSVYFRPTFSKHANTPCAGVQLHITDAARFNGYRTGLHLLHQIRRIFPVCAFTDEDNGAYFIDKLAGTDKLRSGDFEPESFLAQGEDALQQYLRDRSSVLL